MTNKSTKRALVSSVVALFLCFTMLLGTTYAWFTDSVTSATNKIVAGNLDVELYHADKAQPTDELVGDTTKLFDDVTLWEPGAMVWEKLTVKNNGSLALKYVLSVNITDISTVNGKSLADVLKVAVMNVQPTRENVPAAATQDLATFNLESDKELMSGASEEFYVAIYWAPSANDNDYNVASEELYANLGVTLLATQYNYENDSFGADYDEGLDPTATYISSFEELKNAARNGGKIALASDLSITDKSDFFYGSYVTAVYNDLILDLNGHSITIDVPSDSVSEAPILFYVYAEGASLTIVGDGEIIAKNDAFIAFPRGVSEGVYIYGGNFYNIDDSSGTKNDINAIVYSQTNDNIHIYGGTFIFKNVNGHCGAFNVYDNSGAEIILYEGVLLSNSNYYTGSDADEIHLADGCVLDEMVIDGQTWYMVVKEGTDVVGSAEDFIGATEGGNISITDDIVYNNTNPEKQMIMETNSAINFDGNGKTITTQGADPSIGNHGYVAFVPPAGENATVSDITVTGTGFVEIGDWSAQGGTYVANNLVVKDIVSTLANGDKGKTLACGFAHYGKATLNNCTMTGTTAMIDGAMAVDAGFANGTTTLVNGGEYGVIYCWSHAVVTFDGADVDTLYVAPINGNVTVKAGTHIGTLNVDYGTSSANATRLAKLVIEDGASVSQIVYGGNTYSVTEWNAYLASL